MSGTDRSPRPAPSVSFCHRYGLLDSIVPYDIGSRPAIVNIVWIVGSYVGWTWAFYAIRHPIMVPTGLLEILQIMTVAQLCVHEGPVTAFSHPSKGAHSRLKTQQSAVKRCRCKVEEAGSVTGLATQPCALCLHSNPTKMRELLQSSLTAWESLVQCRSLNTSTYSLHVMYLVDIVVLQDLQQI